MKDPKSNREFFLIEGRPDKNHRGGINDLNEKCWAGKIWQNTKSPHYCPVVTIKQYLLLCPEHPRFYLTPRWEVPASGPWFTCQPVGVNQFNKYVKELCESAGLSLENRSVHSFRRTVATWLYEAGWDTPTIMSVTKHKSQRGAMAYMTDTTTHGIAVAEETHLTPTPPEEDVAPDQKDEKEEEEETEVVPPPAKPSMHFTSCVFNNCVFKP